jgi:hypothetical protein
MTGGLGADKFKGTLLYRSEGGSYARTRGGNVRAGRPPRITATERQVRVSQTRF